MDGEAREEPLRALRGGGQRRGRSSLTSCSGPMGARGGGQVGVMMIDGRQEVRGHARVARGRQISKSSLNRQPAGGASECWCGMTQGEMDMGSEMRHSMCGMMTLEHAGGRCPHHG